MVIVDLFPRETILTHLNKRTQDNVAQTLLKYVIFQRGVPRTFRSDNAPELSSVTGVVSAICEDLKSIRSEQEDITREETLYVSESINQLVQ
jgi:hypothetical protein